MSPTDTQLQKISLLSDTLLYPEAVSFIHHLVDEKECEPLPTSQIMGLLNIAQGPSYDDITRFVSNQKGRNWPREKEDIKTFYTELERYLAKLRKRLPDPFQLTTPQLTQREATQESRELMLQLAREFIQHLVAENVLLSQRQEEQKRRNRNGGTRGSY
jgi:hypothetical protein